MPGPGGREDTLFLFLGTQHSSRLSMSTSPPGWAALLLLLRLRQNHSAPSVFLKPLGRPRTGHAV